MLKIELGGGLGNQLFIYAFYRACQLQGKDAVLDLSWYQNINQSVHANYHLDVFDTKVDSYTVSKTYDWFRHFFERRKLDTLCTKLGLIKKYYEKEDGVYDPFFAELTDGYVTGYWQTEKYFAPFAEQIRKELTYTGPWTEKNRAYQQEMNACESISVHVRRGDYLKFNTIYGNICTESYYRRAIDEMEKRLAGSGEKRYFVFSDDIPWCRESLFQGMENVTYVEGNEADASYMDLILMAQCQHHILANSSFSWWGQWLSQKQGITLAPSRWFNNADTRDIWREDWIKL